MLPWRNPSRAAKRRQEGLLDALSECKILHALLSDEAMLHVLQNMSAHPRDHHWQGFVAPEDVLLWSKWVHASPILPAKAFQHWKYVKVGEVSFETGMHLSAELGILFL